MCPNSNDLYYIIIYLNNIFLNDEGAGATTNDVKKINKLKSEKDHI